MENWQLEKLKERYNFELVETHISWVLIGNNFVYKVKKPVDFGFLDYTTLEKRKYFCEQEVKLNKRLAEEIYLGVVTINKQNGDITIEGGGEVLDYAVKMKRMPKERMMDALIKDGKVEKKHIRAFAKKIADFHLNAETNDYISTFGTVEVNKFNTDENFEQTKNGVGEFITKYQYEKLIEYTNGFYKNKKELFERRIKQGKIRDCHGDLYSRNICIVDENRIYVYDCIEFNERFRYSDVASDVAFLLMDLENYGRYDLSDEFLNDYIEFSNDNSLIEIVDFYKVYRAYVRGKIAFFQNNVEEAKRYFDLAFGYLPKEFKPKIVVLSGLTGSGKTTIAKILAKHGFGVISTDVVRKELAGISPYEKDLSDYGKGIYTEEMTRKVYDEIVSRAYNLAREGKNVVLDGTFIKKWQRDKVFEKFKRLGITPLIVFIEIDDKMALEHFKKREKEQSISDGRYEIYQRQKEELEFPGGAFVVSANKKPNGIAIEILNKVGVKR